MRHIKRLTFTNGLAAILLLLIFAFLSYDRFHAAEIRENSENLERCMGTFVELIRHKGEGFTIVNGKLLAGNYVLNNNFEVPDKVREIFGGTATVFMGDMRVSTNVMRNDGQRAVGTRLEGAAYDAVFRNGKPFRGETAILGVPYFTAYDPIRDQSGKVIGALYVGLKKSEFLEHHTLVKTEIILILLGMSAVFIVIMAMFHKVVKKAERTIEDDHRFLQTLIDAIPTPVFYKDVQGRYLGGNKAFGEICELPIEQVIGKTIFDILPPERASKIHQEEQELLRNRKLLIDETAIIHSDGSPSDVISFKATFPTDDGSPGGVIGSMLDITERKMMEMKLLESRQRLSDVIQFYPDATLIIDAEGKVTAWNHAMESLTGVRAAEMLGKGDHEYALPFYDERRPILIDLALQPSEEMEKKYPKIERNGQRLIAEGYIHAQGRELYFHGTAAPLRNSEGKLIGAIESIRDITERKKTEEMLADKERLISGILDSIQDGICMLDTDLRIIQTNPFFETYYAAKMPFAGKKCHEIFWESQVPCDLCPSLKTLQSGKPASKVFSDHHDGKDFWFELTTFPLFDRDRLNVTGVVECVREITERKVSEEKLRTLSCGIEQSPASIMITDRQGNIEYANPKFTLLTGYSSVEVIGQNPRILKTGLTPPEVHRQLWETILSGQEWHGEFCNRKKSGELYWEHASISPILDDNGEISRFIAVKEDITDRKRMEEELIFKNVILSTQQETSIDGILVVDGNGAIISYNRRFIEMLDFPPELVEAGDDAPVLQFATGKMADPEGFLARIRYLYEHIEEKSHDEIVLKDGRIFNRYSAPMNGPNRSYYGRVWYFRDITEQKNTEKNLAEREKFLSLILDSIQDGISVIDTELNIVRTNTMLERRFPTQMPLVGRKCYEAYHGRSEPCVICPSIATINSGEPASIIFSMEDNGETAWLELFTFPIFSPDQSRITGVIEYVKNITSRKRTEEEVRQLNTELELKVDERTRELLAAQEELVRKEKLAILGQLSGSVDMNCATPWGS
jgi:PAS domain S-box-containing protein